MTQVSMQSNIQLLIDAHKENHLYAVVDCARDDKIHHNLEANDADYYSLFYGKEAEDLEQAAPYLVRLKQGDAFTQWYVDNSFGNAMSILLSSSHTELELQEHLQSYSKPLMEFETEDGIKYQEVFLAFYDPRVFPNYLRSISVEHRIAFLQPFKSVFYESSEKILNQLLPNARRNNVKLINYDFEEVQTFDQLENEFPPEPGEALDQDEQQSYQNYQPIIDIETNKKLLDYNFQIFIDELLEHLIENNLIQATAGTTKDARRYIQQQAREAQNYGMSNEAAITYYIQAKLLYGVGFANDPQYLHLVCVLQNETISDINQADILFEAFEQYEKHVYGEENTYLDEAYKQALDLNDAHIKKCQLMSCCILFIQKNLTT